jgi:radical SAM protein with 4Fe4S-binding SPASM domain
MSGETFAIVERELFPSADLIDLRGWGESLILPEFEDRARRASVHGAALRVVTNLSFRRDDAIALLAELQFHVGVSVDSADPDILAKLRRGANAELISHNLRHLSDAYQRLGIIDRLNIYVTCQRPALGTLERVVDWASDHGVRYVRFAPVGSNAVSLSISSSETVVRTALDRIRSRALARNLDVSVTASLIEGMFPNHEASPCLHPWMWCYIAYDGGIGFCDHLVGADHYTLGSILQTPFDEIWNGKGWVELRREHVGDRREGAAYFHECAWCYRNRHVDCENIVEPRAEKHRLRLTAIS